jgi:streptogramin lyase
LTLVAVGHIISVAMTRLSPPGAFCWILSSLLLLALVRGTDASGENAGGGPFMTEFPLPGSPYQVAVEAPNLAWATLPAQNAIVRLLVTLPGLYDVALFELPVAGSEPYDIAFAAGRIWVTERSGNRIGCFDTDTTVWTEYPIPTIDSQPTGITVLEGNPIEVWFAERAGNKLGRLRVSDTGSATVDEYELPAANASPESVSAITAEPIWFTAPGISSIGRFRPSLWPGSFGYAFVPTGSGSQPWDIEMDTEGTPWFTEPHGNRLGKYTPGTLTYFTWYYLPISGSAPYGLDLARGATWFTEIDGDRVGQLQPVTGAMREFALPGAAPTGIAVDASGCAWVAASHPDRLISWCSPYFWLAFLPLVWRD